MTSHTEAERNTVVFDEKRSWLLPVSIVAGVLLTAVLWWTLTPHGTQPPFLTFENASIGCRFEYPSAMNTGPNFLRASSGSIMTIERHSLEMAKKDWVAGLPDVLFPQVLIQLQENYADLEETGRVHLKVDGRDAVEVVLRGRAVVTPGSPSLVTILIVANDDWVYVLRTYSLEKLDMAERPLFRHVRETWKFLSEPAPGATPEAAPVGDNVGGAAGDVPAPESTSTTGQTGIPGEPSSR